MTFSCSYLRCGVLGLLLSFVDLIYRGQASCHRIIHLISALWPLLLAPPCICCRWPCLFVHLPSLSCLLPFHDGLRSVEYSEPSRLLTSYRHTISRANRCLAHDRCYFGSVLCVVQVGSSFTGYHNMSSEKGLHEVMRSRNRPSAKITDRLLLRRNI